MFPNSSSLNYDVSKHLVECHKETQTSSTTVKDSSTLSDPNTADKGSLTIFEFNELLQDPKHPRDVTIIKDVFSEETHDHDSDSSDSDPAKSNRYTYCREVIKPYLKEYPADCPVSEEQLIRDALLAAHKDYPDYQPCFEIYDGNKDIKVKKDSGQSENVDKGSKSSSESGPISKGIKEKSSKSCKASKSNKSISSKTKTDDTKSVQSEISILEKGSKSNSSETRSLGKGKKSNQCKRRHHKDKKSNSSEDIDVDLYINKVCKSEHSKSSIGKKEFSTDSSTSNMCDDEERPPKKRDPRCPKKTRRPSIEDEVFKTGKRSPAGPPSACKNKSTEGLSTCKNTPSVGSCKNEEGDEGSSSKEKKKEENPCQHQMTNSGSTHSLTMPNSSRPKTMADAHPETMATIKIAVEDFFGKVYQTTKDAVTLIKSESAKQICSILPKKSESASDLHPRKVSDDHENKNTETNNFKFFRDLEDPDLRNHDPKDDNSGRGLSKTAQMVVGKILNKVDSTISMLSNHVDMEKVTSLMNVKNLSEKSSPYDKTLEETAASNPKSSSVGNSVFTALKSKIMSMFSENEMKEEPKITSGSSEVPSNNDLETESQISSSR